MFILLIILALPFVESSTICTDGFSPHQTDCSKYYICGHEDQRILMQCPGGLHFDERLNVCNHPSEVKCNKNTQRYYDNGCPTDHNVHHLLPHESDCSKFYYCNYGVKVESDCPPGTHFDYILQTCNWASEVHCESNGSLTTSSSLITEATSDYTTGVTTIPDISTIATTSDDNIPENSDTSTTVTNEFTTTAIEDIPDEACNTDEHLLLPHESNCSMFYYCDHGYKKLRVCPTNLHFNPVLQICDHPSVVVCKISTTPSQVQTTTQSTPITAEPTIIEPSTAKTTTTKPVTDTTNQPITTEVYSEFTEPETLTPGSSTATDVAITDSDTQTTSDKTTLTESGHPTTPICTPGTFGAVPHPERCDAYFMCAGGIPMPLFCIDGFEFDPRSERCVPIGPGGCTYMNFTTPASATSITTEATVWIPTTTEATIWVPTTTESVQTTTPSICPPGAFINVPHPERCDAYFMCVGGVPVPLFCLDGQEFDPESERCVEIAPGGCTNMQSTTVDAETGTTALPPVTNPITTSQPLTTTERSETTEWSTTSVVTEQVTAEPTTTDPTTDLTTAEPTTAPPTTLPTTLGPITAQTTTQPIESTTWSQTTTESVQMTTPSICPPGSFGNVPHPERCDAYFMCVGGVPVPLFCLDGQEFDPELERCVEIAPGGCTSMQSTTIDAETGSTALPPVTNPITTSQPLTTTERSETTEWSTTSETIVTEPNTVQPSTAETTTTELTTAESTTEDLISTESTTAQSTTWPTTLGPITAQTTTQPIESTTWPQTTTESVQMTTPSICPPGSFGNVPHPERCDAYFMCVGGVPVPLFCLDGQEFDPELERCVEIAPGGCTSMQSTTIDAETGSTALPPVTNPITTSQPLTTTERSETTEWSTTSETIVTEPNTVQPSTAETTTTELTTAESTTEDLISTESTTAQSTTWPTTLGPITAQTTTQPIESTTWAQTTTESVQMTTPSICAPGSFGNVPHPERCDAYFMCVGGVPVPLFCLNGQEFDPELERCVEIAPGGCTNMQSTTVDAETGTTALPPVTNPITTSQPLTTTERSETTEWSTTSETIVTEPNTVQPSTAETTTTELTTAESTTEDLISTESTTAQSTTWPTTLGPITAQTTTQPIESTTWSQTTTESVQTTTPSICPPGSFGNVPHPERCDAYFMCVGGVPVPLFCLDGQEFDPELERCVEIAPGGCTNMQSTTVEAETGSTALPPVTNPITTSQPLTTTERSATTEWSTTSVVTEQVTAEPTTTDPTSDLTTAEPTTAPPTTLPTTLGPITAQTTTQPIESTTWSQTTTESVQTTTPSICPPGSFGNVPHPERCDAYFMCVGGVPVPLFCLDGQEFDPELERCVEIAPGGCTSMQSTTIDAETGSTALPPVTNPITTSQPLTTTERSETTEWSTTSETIVTEPNTVQPSTAETTTTELTTAESTTEDLISTESTTAQSTTWPTTLGPITAQTTTQPIESTTWAQTTTESVQMTTPSICAPGSFGNVPHPERCDAYFMCVGGVPVPLFCLNGQEFDPELERCVEIAPGGCTNMQSTTVDAETGTTALPPVTNPITTSQPLTTTERSETTEWSTTSETIVTEPNTVQPSTAETTTTELTTAESTTEDLISTESTTAQSTTWPTTLGPITAQTTTQPIESTTWSQTTTESVQTTTPSICPPGSFGNVPHPERCDAYFMCVGGVPVPLFCLDGQEFDPELERCVEIAPGGCTNMQSTTVEAETGSTALPPVTNPITTSQPLTTTERSATTEWSTTSVVTEQVTAEPTTTDPTSDLTTAEPTTAPPTTLPTTLGPITAQTTTQPIESTTWSQTTTESVQTTTPSICPPGSFGNVPHPERCDAYFMCVGGVPVPLFCLDGQEFDPELERCVEIAPGGCTSMQSTTIDAETGSTALPPVTNPITTSQPLTTTERSETTEWSTTSETIVTEPNTVQPSTAETTTTELTTAESTTEDLISTESTTAQSTTWPTTLGPITAQTTTQPIESTTWPQTTTESVQMTTPSICPPGSFGNVPHPERCDAYFMCVGGVPVPLFCLDGQEFDPELERCVEIAPGGCTYMQSTTVADLTTAHSTTESVQTTTPSICAPGSFGNVPHPERCDAYYMCVGGVPVPLFCLDGQEFDPESERCVDIAPGGCTYRQSTTTDATTGSSVLPTVTDSITTTTESVQTTTPSICPPGAFINVPHPERCDAYYMCVSGVPVPLFCLEGQEFDPELLICVSIAPGGCTYRTSTTTVATSSVELSTNWLSTTTESIQMTTPAICPPGAFINVPHPERCDAYYMCVSGVPVPLFCLDGQEFDPELEICVTIAEGGCTLGTPEKIEDIEPVIARVQQTVDTQCHPGDILRYLPHTDKCDVYYMCNNGNLTTLHCQNGYEFNNESQLCILKSHG